MYDVTAFAYKGDVYCEDCAEELTEDAEEWESLKDDSHRDGGPMFDHNETETQWHCGMGKKCVNTTTDHEYGHNNPVGKPIECIVLDYLEEPTTEDPEIHVENTDEFVFTIHSNNFKYKVEYEVDADNIVLIERTNRGTRETERYTDMPESMEQYAREIVEEGKQAGALWA